MYVVTGGAGFIGSHLVDRLLAQGARVRVLDNFSTGRPENLASSLSSPGTKARLEVREGDLRDPDVCRSMCQGVATVFHLAAVGSVARSVEDPLTTSAVNIQGTLHLLVAAREAGVRRFVFASTAAVYGNGAVPPFREEMPVTPLSPYAVSKIAGEHFCGVFSRLYGLETACLRFFNVFGPRQDPASRYASLVPLFLQRALRDDLPLPVFGDGLQSRDFVYVDNVVEATLLAARAPIKGGVVLNVGTGRPTTVLEMVEAMSRLLRKAVPVAHEAPRPGEVRHSYADISRARHILGYEPRIDVEEGLRRVRAFLDGGGTPPAGAG